MLGNSARVESAGHPTKTPSPWSNLDSAFNAASPQIVSAEYTGGQRRGPAGAAAVCRAILGQCGSGLPRTSRAQTRGMSDVACPGDATVPSHLACSLLVELGR